MAPEHRELEKASSTAPMLPAPPAAGKLLLREDTLGVLPGCACGRARLACAAPRCSALCWGRPTQRKYACMMTTLIATFLVSLVGTVFFCFTDFLNNAILSNMVLANNSMAFKMWQHPTVQPLMKVHIFNYTNIDRVRGRRDSKLKVHDVGPFVYSESLERVNVKFHGDGTMSYQEKASFTFLPELSAGYTQYDRVVVPNLPLIATIHKSVQFGLFAQLSLSAGLNMPGVEARTREAFTNLAADSFLWGYDDQIIKIAKPILKWQGDMPYERFGLLVTKKGLRSEKITINTGEKDIDQVNMIERMNGQTSLNHWGTPSCNSIKASDGSIFPASLLDRNKTLYIFNHNLCRRLPFVYQKDVEVLDGIQALRYAPPLDVFDEPSRNPENQCYCHIDSGHCPPRGVVNVSVCAHGTPAMASFPHFYLADQDLINSIDGLQPVPELHNTYMDLHPKLGIPLNVKFRLQINIQVPKTDSYFSELNYLKEGAILPVAWIETTMGPIPQNIRTLVYHGTYSTAAAQLALSWGCGLLLACSTLGLVVLLRRRRRAPCATVRMLPDGFKSAGVA